MNPTSLIIGVTGQDGSYLAEHLAGLGQRVCGTVRGLDHPKVDWLRSLVPGIELYPADLLDEASLRLALEQAKPDHIYNLGAVASPSLAWTHPLLTAEVTGLGVCRLLEAVRTTAPSAAVVQAGSVARHGPYGAAKQYAQLICDDYRSRGLHVFTAVFGGHHSPRKAPSYFSRKITRAVAAIVRGEQATVRVGHLDGRRDWGWAPDFMHAISLLPAWLEPDNYVVSTGAPHTAREWVHTVFKLAGLDWTRHVQRDAAAGNVTEADQSAAPDPRLAPHWKPNLDFTGLAEVMLRADLPELAVGLR